MTCHLSLSLSRPLRPDMTGHHSLSLSLPLRPDMTCHHSLSVARPLTPETKWDDSACGVGDSWRRGHQTRRESMWDDHRTVSSFNSDDTLVSRPLPSVCAGQTATQCLCWPSRYPVSVLVRLLPSVRAGQASATDLMVDVASSLVPPLPNTSVPEWRLWELPTLESDGKDDGHD